MTDEELERQVRALLAQCNQAERRKLAELIRRRNDEDRTMQHFHQYMSE
jgi:hypothetical protein